MSSRDARVVDREGGSAEATPSAMSFGLRSTSKIRDRHLDRLAMVYVRQSSPQQVIENRESRERQYALAQFAQRLVLLCQLSRYPLWHAHELTQQPLLGRFEPEPVADLAMYLRQGHATPVRPRGKKPAAVVPGGRAPAAAATRARPESCTPASHSPRADGSPATDGPDPGPSPAAPWPPREIAPPSAAGARTPPSAP